MRFGSYPNSMPTSIHLPAKNNVKMRSSLWRNPCVATAPVAFVEESEARRLIPTRPIRLCCRTPTIGASNAAAKLVRIHAELLRLLAIQMWLSCKYLRWRRGWFEICSIKPHCQKRDGQTRLGALACLRGPQRRGLALTRNIPDDRSHLQAEVWGAGFRGVAVVDKRRLCPKQDFRP